MGIPRFGIWISKNVDNAVISKINKRIAGLYIDGNGILHKARATAFKEGTPEQDEYRKYLLTLTEIQIWDLIIEQIQIQCLNVFNEFSPSEEFMFAVDGVAPVAKCLQQRGRREKAAMETLRNPGQQLFDRNAITPGTKFMDYLDRNLEQFFKSFKSCKRVIYSSHRVVGEGEHKILEHLRANGTPGDIVVSGLDADLILLLMTVNTKHHIYLSRESFIEFVDVNKVKATLSKQVGVENFIVVMFFIGNDFMHSFSMNRDMGKSIQKMITVIEKNRLSLVANGSINWKDVIIFARDMSRSESFVLYKEADYLIANRNLKNRRLRRDALLEAAQCSDRDTFFNIYYNAYYDKELSPHNPSLAFLMRPVDMREHATRKLEQMCKDTATGLEWYYKYYTQGTSAINHDWYYPSYHAPLFVDFYNYISQPGFKFLNLEYKPYSGMQIFTTAQQLVSVIPKASMNILPDILHQYYDIDSPLVDTFPSYVELDMTGKLAEHEAVPIIPLIDKRKILEAVQLQEDVGVDRIYVN